jgi:hypothetical protein
LKRAYFIYLRDERNSLSCSLRLSKIRENKEKRIPDVTLEILEASLDHVHVMLCGGDQSKGPMRIY